jgi:GAF domain
MSCRACSGDIAPPVGTRLNTETGFTATCVRTAEFVRCDDTETDSRVDGSSCAELRIRSILAVPIFDGQKVAGVLEVLSSKPSRFTNRHVTALKLLGRLVETLVNNASRNDSLLDAATTDARPQANNSSKATVAEPRIVCLSCGRSNPQDSQFCNRCGVIVLTSPVPQETIPDLSRRPSLEENTDEGLRDIYKLIAGSAGLATWNEIYANLLANMQNTPAPEKPHAAAPEKTATREGNVTGFGRAQGASEPKSVRGAPVRRSLWL